MFDLSLFSCQLPLHVSQRFRHVVHLLLYFALVSQVPQYLFTWYDALRALVGAGYRVQETSRPVGVPHGFVGGAVVLAVGTAISPLLAEVPLVFVRFFFGENSAASPACSRSLRALAEVVADGM